MKFKVDYIENELKKTNQIDITSHPSNKRIVSSIQDYLNKETQINVIEMKNNRYKLIDLSSIETIISVGHMSQVLTTDGEKYYLNKRLKELSYLEEQWLCRVNQSF